MELFYLLSLIALIAVGLYFVFLGFGFPFQPASLIGEKIVLIPAFGLILLAFEIGFLWLVYIKAPTPQESVAEAFRYLKAYSAATAIRSRTIFPIPMTGGLDLINIASNKRNLVREYEMEAKTDEEFQILIDNTKGWLDQTLCTDPSNAPIFKEGMGLETWFHQKSTPYVAKFVWTPEQCGFKS
jgi:hypothetical protein